MRVTIECFSRRRVRERGEQVLGRSVQFVAQVFRGLFEFGEIIAVGLDQVADALDRIGLEARALVAVGHLGGDQGLAAAGFGIGGVQSLQRMRHAGAQFGEIAQFLLGQVDLPEQRIGKDLVQLGEEAVLVGGGQIAQIEVIGLRQPQQDLRRHRALVALDQVDVARAKCRAPRRSGSATAPIAAGSAGTGVRRTVSSRNRVAMAASLALGRHSGTARTAANSRNLEIPGSCCGPSRNDDQFCDKNYKITSMTSRDVT